ncbi:MAG: uncharacterized protein QOI49_2917 [Verrucomicrobiota bacterium]|jgi:uncharacterized protein YqjF (DUF2071 family)
MENVVADRSTLSETARRRMLALPGEPMFYARWDRAVFIHYEADPATLQRDVPFDLDLREGRAFVSIVAFTLSRMRPRLGGRLGEWLFKPIATHEFLNVRTYVRHRGEPGIYFLAEWLSNPLSVRLGPRTFGLPYRFGRLAYQHALDGRALRGTLDAPQGRLAYEGEICGSDFAASEAQSLTEFMLERYTAFTQHGKRDRFFRVWHSPWEQAPAEIAMTADTVMASTGPWWKTAERIGGNYSGGAEVWMGRPHRLSG